MKPRNFPDRKERRRRVARGESTSDLRPKDIKVKIGKHGQGRKKPGIPKEKPETDFAVYDINSAYPYAE